MIYFIIAITRGNRRGNTSEEAEVLLVGFFI